MWRSYFGGLENYMGCDSQFDDSRTDVKTDAHYCKFDLINNQYYCTCGYLAESFADWAKHAWRPSGKSQASYKRHPNSARFHEILKELGELHDRYLELIEELKGIL